MKSPKKPRLLSKSQVLKLIEEENTFWDELTKAQTERDLKFGDIAREEENGQ